MKDVPEIGKLIMNGEKRRDAIHVAVAPVVAQCPLNPGDRIGFVSKGNCTAVTTMADEPIGIVDPFLTEPVQPGQSFWMFLFPNTIESLRHVWTHPSFHAKGGKE